MKTIYSPPVDQLLTLGDCRQSTEWPNYLQLGFTNEHIPELIRMATDKEIYRLESNSLEVWAPIHAWRLLGQLEAEEAIEPLLSMIEEDDDWTDEEIPEVYGMIGAKAIPALSDYLKDSMHNESWRITAAHGLECIGNKHSELRAQCISQLTAQLDRCEKENLNLNGFLVSFLLELEATESISNIRKAFEKNCVNCHIAGDIEDIEIHFGLRDKRSKAKEPFWNIIAPITRTSPKVGRNDQCPCGSGKKYKKCCLDKIQ